MLKIELLRWAVFLCLNGSCVDAFTSADNKGDCIRAAETIVRETHVTLPYPLIKGGRGEKSLRAMCVPQFDITRARPVG